MGVDQWMDPFIDLAESLRRAPNDAVLDEATVQQRADIREGVRELCALLEDTAGDVPERVRAAALLVGSLSPAVRRGAEAELRELARRMPADAKEAMLGSASPHVRAGVRVMQRLSIPADPAEVPSPRSALPVLRRPVGETPSFAEDRGPEHDRTAEMASTSADDAAVLAALARPEAPIREGAIRGLAGTPLAEDVVRSLLRIITDDASADTRLAAVHAFKDETPERRAAAAERASMTDEPALHEAAVGLLVGGTGVELVAASRLLRSDHFSAASKAVDVLASMPAAEAVAVLWSSVAHVTERLQDKIFRRLREIDEKAFENVVRVSAAGMDVPQRAAALVALSELDVDRPDEIQTALRDPAPEIRRAALRSLSRRWDPDAFDIITSCRRDPRPDVRVWVVALLRAAADDRALPHLLEAAADPVEEIRRAAHDAIRSMASGDAIDRIIRALNDEASASTAEAVLADLGERMVTRLIAHLDELGEKGLERATALLRSARAGAAIRIALRGSDPMQRRHAAHALFLMRGSEAVPGLLELFDDPSPDVRVRAVELIARAGGAGEAEQLALLQLRDPDPDVQQALARARRRVDERDGGSRLEEEVERVST